MLSSVVLTAVMAGAFHAIQKHVGAAAWQAAIRSFRDFSAIGLAVALVYLALEVWANAHYNPGAAATLADFERRLARFDDLFTQIFEWVDAAFLLGGILLLSAALTTGVRAWLTWARGAKSAFKPISLLATFLALMGSVSFFGATEAKAVGEIRAAFLAARGDATANAAEVQRAAMQQALSVLDDVLEDEFERSCMSEGGSPQDCDLDQLRAIRSELSTNARTYHHFWQTERVNGPFAALEGRLEADNRLTSEVRASRPGRASIEVVGPLSRQVNSVSEDNAWVAGRQPEPSAVRREALLELLSLFSSEAGNGIGEASATALRPLTDILERAAKRVFTQTAQAVLVQMSQSIVAGGRLSDATSLARSWVGTSGVREAFRGAGSAAPQAFRAWRQSIAARELKAQTRSNRAVQEALAVERRGHWGALRTRLVRSITSQTEEWAKPGQLERAKELVARWVEDRKAIAERLVRSGAAITPDRWDIEFLEYTYRTPHMAALWGYAVITAEPNAVFSDQLERYADDSVRELSDISPDVVREEFYGRIADRELKGLASPSRWERLSSRERASIAAQIIRHYFVDVHGPKPFMGYMHYANTMARKTSMDFNVSTFVKSDEFNEGVEKFCPL